LSFARLRSVRKVFPAGELGPSARDDLIALDDATFSYDEGEFVALLGPSGCGRTTSLRIVAGLVARTSGELTIGGRDVQGPYADYDFVFQSPALMPWRSVLDNILLPMDVLHRRDRQAVVGACELLKLVGLKGFEQALPSRLSGGMQQRVSLCRALIHQPKLLLMDEPFGALDELTRLEMNDLLLDVRQETGAAALFVTHSIADAVYLAGKVLVFTCRPARLVTEIRPGLGRQRQRQRQRQPSMRFEASFLAAERAAGEALGVITRDPSIAAAGRSGVAVS